MKHTALWIVALLCHLQIVSSHQDTPPKTNNMLSKAYGWIARECYEFREDLKAIRDCFSTERADARLTSPKKRKPRACTKINLTEEEREAAILEITTSRLRRRITAEHLATLREQLAAQKQSAAEAHPSTASTSVTKKDDVKHLEGQQNPDNPFVGKAQYWQTDRHPPHAGFDMC